MLTERFVNPESLVALCSDDFLDAPLEVKEVKVQEGQPPPKFDPPVLVKKDPLLEPKRAPMPFGNMLIYL